VKTAANILIIIATGMSSPAKRLIISEGKKFCPRDEPITAHDVTQFLNPFFSFLL
jgi:hypothetical protein